MSLCVDSVTYRWQLPVPIWVLQAECWSGAVSLSSEVKKWSEMQKSIMSFFHYDCSLQNIVPSYGFSGQELLGDGLLFLSMSEFAGKNFPGSFCWTWMMICIILWCQYWHDIFRRLCYIILQLSNINLKFDIEMAGLEHLLSSVLHFDDLTHIKTIKRRLTSPKPQDSKQEHWSYWFCHFFPQYVSEKWRTKFTHCCPTSNNHGFAASLQILNNGIFKH